MMIHSQLLTVTGGTASNSLSRSIFVGDKGNQGVVNSLELDFYSIAGGATTITKLTLSWINADRRYLANADTSGLTINLDAGDATKGSYEVNVDKQFNGIPADATGLYVGITLNAGTASYNAYLNIRGHA